MTRYAVHMGDECDELSIMYVFDTREQAEAYKEKLEDSDEVDDYYFHYNITEVSDED